MGVYTGVYTGFIEDCVGVIIVDSIGCIKGIVLGV